MRLESLKFKIFNFQSPIGFHPLPPILPCACLLDSIKDTPLFTNWLMIFISGVFFLGALVAFFLAWKRGYLDLKEIEEVKNRVLEDCEEK